MARVARACTVAGCERPYKARGYCSTHHWRWSNGKDVDAPVAEMGVHKTCTVEGCERRYECKGYCPAHYYRFVNGLDMQRPIGRRGKPASGEWGEWQEVSNGYIGRSRTVDGVPEKQLQHRVVMEEHLGRPLLKGENVHHLNGDRADNRLKNLELWSTRQPSGQRVEDKIAWAKELLHQYGEHCC